LSICDSIKITGNSNHQPKEVKYETAKAQITIRVKCDLTGLGGRRLPRSNVTFIVVIHA
jgi:hypothetical protein